MKKLILFLLIIITLPTFGQIKLSQLTETTTLNTNDLFLVSKGTASRKLQFTNLRYSVLNPIPFALRMNYLSDSLRMYFSADSTMFNTNNSFFKFNKPIYANGVLLGAGGGAPTDTVSLGVALSTAIKNGPWDWQTDKYNYNPDSTGTGAVGGWYKGNQNPLKTTRYNLNGLLQPTLIQITRSTGSSLILNGSSSNNPVSISYSGTEHGIDMSNTSTGTAFRINNSGTGLPFEIVNGVTQKAYINKDGAITGATVTANGGSLYGVVGYSTSSNAGNFQLNSSGSNSSDAVIVQRNMSGTANASGDLLKIYENSTSSGTLGGNLISGYWGAVQKFSIDKEGFISHKGCFASIYRNGSGADQSIPTGTTPTKITAFTTNGYASNCTADATNDKITITKTGYYDLNLSLSYSSGTANVTWTAYIFNGGSEVANIHSSGKAVTANDIRSTAITGIIYVSSVPADIDYRVSHDNGGSVNLNISYANLKVTYLGD